MPSLRDPIPDDREPSWKRRTPADAWQEEWGSKVHPDQSTSELRDSLGRVREYAGKKVKTALAISIIVSIAAMIFAGLVEKRYRQTTQGEVTQIVKRIEAERDAWQRRYETGQETWDGERKKLEATINSTRRAREAAEEKAEGLARENATLRAKLASREESR